MISTSVSFAPVGTPYSGAEPPFTYFREHKLELSVVRCINDRWTVQLGAFAAPAGQNSVAERGIALSLWMRR